MLGCFEFNQHSRRNDELVSYTVGYRVGVGDLRSVPNDIYCGAEGAEERLTGLWDEVFVSARKQPRLESPKGANLWIRRHLSDGYWRRLNHQNRRRASKREPLQRAFA